MDIVVLDDESKKFRNPAGNSNGHASDWQDRHLSREPWNRRMVRDEHDGELTAIEATFDGKPFNAPSDVGFTPNGSISFTDPGYGSMME